MWVIYCQSKFHKLGTATHTKTKIMTVNLVYIYLAPCQYNRTLCWDIIFCKEDGAVMEKMKMIFPKSNQISLLHTRNRTLQSNHDFVGCLFNSWQLICSIVCNSFLNRSTKFILMCKSTKNDLFLNHLPLDWTCCPIKLVLVYIYTVSTRQTLNMLNMDTYLCRNIPVSQYCHSVCVSMCIHNMNFCCCHLQDIIIFLKTTSSTGKHASHRTAPSQLPYLVEVTIKVWCIMITCGRKSMKITTALGRTSFIKHLLLQLPGMEQTSIIMAFQCSILLYFDEVINYTVEHICDLFVGFFFFLSIHHSHFQHTWSFCLPPPPLPISVLQIRLICLCPINYNYFSMSFRWAILWCQHL